MLILPGMPDRGIFVFLWALVHTTIHPVFWTQFCCLGSDVSDELTLDVSWRKS